MSNKAKELNASVKLVNDRLKFEGNVGEYQSIAIDYIPPLGDNSGYTSLELLLLSLTSCMGSSILTFLRRMNKTISNCEISAKGLRKEEHPTGFKSIFVTVDINSADVTDDDMLKVIKLTEEKYCPVWSMVKGNVEVKVNYKINNQNI